jgi:hypothetical protein
MKYGRKLKGKVTMGWIMAVLLGTVMFASLIGTIADQADLASQGGNVTGAADTLLGLVALIVVIVFIYKLVGGRR